MSEKKELKELSKTFEKFMFFKGDLESMIEYTIINLRVEGDFE